MIIESAQNKHYKWLKSLTKKKYRDQEGAFLIEGVRMVEHALSLGVKLMAVYISESSTWSYQDLVPITLKASLFNDLADTVNSQGVLAVVDLASLQAIDMAVGKHVVVLDGIQDPGNMGTLIRTCDAMGIHEVYVTRGSVDVFSQKVLRSTMGSIFTVKVFKGWDPEDLVDYLRYNKYLIVATALEDSVPLSGFNTDKPVAMVFGNEGRGVSPYILNLVDQAVHIPMKGSAESLNVGVASGIALYHLNTYCH